MKVSLKNLAITIGVLLVAVYLIWDGLVFHYGPLSAYMASRGVVGFSRNEFKEFLPDCLELGMDVPGGILGPAYTDFSPYGEGGDGATNWLTKACSMEFIVSSSPPLGLPCVGTECDVYFRVEMGVKEYQSVEQAATMQNVAAANYEPWEQSFIPRYMVSEPNAKYRLPGALYERPTSNVDEVVQLVRWTSDIEERGSIFETEYRIISRHGNVILEVTSYALATGDPVFRLDHHSPESQHLMNWLVERWSVNSW